MLALMEPQHERPHAAPDRAAERFPEIRDALRALCASFPDDHHRRIDAEGACPGAFVLGLPRSH